MTRINLVHPVALSDQHLFAEWREIKHIPAFLKQLIDKGKSIEEIRSKIPARFTLNKGHKYFFVDKLAFLDQRYKDLTEELIKRNYELERISFERWDKWLESIPLEYFYKEFNPGLYDLGISNYRISERLTEKPNWYRYYGEVKDPQFFCRLMVEQMG